MAADITCTSHLSTVVAKRYHDDQLRLYLRGSNRKRRHCRCHACHVLASTLHHLEVCWSLSTTTHCKYCNDTMQQNTSCWIFATHNRFGARVLTQMATVDNKYNNVHVMIDMLRSGGCGEVKQWGRLGDMCFNARGHTPASVARCTTQTPDIRCSAHIEHPTTCYVTQHADYAERTKRAVNTNRVCHSVTIYEKLCATHPARCRQQVEQRWLYAHLCNAIPNSIQPTDLCTYAHRGY